MLQEEQDRSAQFQEVIQQLEEDLRRFDDEMQLRDKSISSLQFEKAANVERLKSAESSEPSASNHDNQQA